MFTPTVYPNLLFTTGFGTEMVLAVGVAAIDQQILNDVAVRV